MFVALSRYRVFYDAIYYICHSAHSLLAQFMPTDEELVLGILQAEKACQYHELIARAYNQFTIKKARVDSAFIRLKTQATADSVKIYIRSGAKRKPSWFCYDTVNVGVQERQRIINEKKLLPARYYHYKNKIGGHAEQLVQQVCQKLPYKSKVWHRVYVGKKRHIDVFAKHPSGRYWQAISVKNHRRPIRDKYALEILDIVKIARGKWKRRIIQPAIVASYTYSQYGVPTATSRYGIPVALLEEQVAPTTLRTLCDKLNQRLAFNFEITDTPPQIMKDNIAEYLVKRG